MNLLIEKDVFKTRAVVLHARNLVHSSRNQTETSAV
jgi:hypothetical protein